MPSVRIDFETRSEIDLTEVGAYLYSIHDSTSVTSLSFKVGGRLWHWHPFTGSKTIPKILERMILDEKIFFEAHNAMFEYYIWNNVCTRMDWPRIEMERWECSAANASLHALPRSLEGLGLALDAPIKKDKEGKKVMMKVAQPRRPTKSDPDTKWHEKPEDLIVLFEYNKTDVLAEESASEMLAPMDNFEREHWLSTCRLNDRGVRIDRAAIEGAKRIIDQLQIETNAELWRITDGKVKTAAELDNILEFLEANGTFIPNLQANTVAETLEAEIEMPAVCKRVLQIRQEMSKASTKKIFSMLNRIGPDDRVREILRYRGASTGRLAGQGIQIQNLPGLGELFDENVDVLLEKLNLAIEFLKLGSLSAMRMAYDDVLNTISSCLRGLIIASEGCIFRAVDYNAIEARILFWLSDCKTGLKEYDSGLDLYKGLAVDIYGVAYEKVTKLMRFVAKQARLGCGFQMGPDRFIGSCAQRRVVVDKETATKAVQGFRRRYKEVPQFWYNLESAAFQCVLTKKSQRVGRLLFESEGRTLTLLLPSGRKLYYWDPSIKEQSMPWGGTKDSVHFWYVDSQTGKWVEGPIYGGLWAENACQAVAADIMVDGAMRAEAAGYTMAFTVHDELVTDDLKDFGSLKELEEILLKTPKWAQGLPIAVEGWEGVRYRK